MDGRNRMELIGQYHDTPGGYRLPCRAVLSSCSDEVNIKGYGGGVLFRSHYTSAVFRCTSSWRV